MVENMLKNTSKSKKSKIFSFLILSVLITAILSVLSISIVSAEILINQQPLEIYNLGDTINIPVTIKTTKDVTGSFDMNLICNGHELNFYKNGVSLSSGEEIRFEPFLVLTKNVISELRGDCVIKAILVDDYVLTNKFKISGQIEIRITNENNEFLPGKPILIKGEALKENKKDVDGFIEVQLMFADANASEIQTLKYSEAINKGFFLVNISTSEDMKAGTYAAIINAYEKDLVGEITNFGSTTYDIYIAQVPTSLEILFDNENAQVEPGTNLIVKAILHDQTGEKIPSSAIISIRDKKDKVVEQTEISTDEFLEYPIPYNQAPEEWKIYAVSNKLTSESSFDIIEKKELKAEILNQTLILTNIGNVPYNENVLLKIGDKPVNILVNLDVDESQKYVLTAPDGEYEVEVMGIKENVALTGKAIDVREAPGGVFSLIRYPFVWIFIIFILGFVAFMIVRKGYKRSFIGRIRIGRKKSKKPQPLGEVSAKTYGLSPLSKKSLIITKNKAEVSLSIKGNKQTASVVGIHIKNLNEIQTKKTNAELVIQKIVELADIYKSAVYENNNNLFFILAPVKTKTFKNEKLALDLAQKAKQLLDHHNKLFKQKIDYGISLNQGEIISKQEPDGILKFMSLGTFITGTRKIASLAHNDILLSEKINPKLISEIKTEKHKKDNVPVYIIKDIKHKIHGHEKFIRSFLDRMEKESSKK